MSSQEKKNTFYGAAVILTITTIVVKIIGAIYKIPLTALLTDAAYGDFNSAYNIYSFFLTISTAGLPVALSKTVSETHALGHQNQKNRVFRVAFCAFLFMGVISFLCMSVGGQFVATHVLRNDKAMYCVVALAPSVLCTCCCSAFRGYAQGHLNMMPTGISQIIEALCKLFLGLGLAILILRMAIQPAELGERLSAAGALAGVSVGSILSLAYLGIRHMRAEKRQTIPAIDRPNSSSEILSRLLKLAIPITLSSCTMSIVTLIDTNLVMSQLQTVFTAMEGGLVNISNSLLDIFPKSVALLQGNTAALLADPNSGVKPVLDAARGLYGVYSKTMSVYNLPFNLMIPLTACIVPAVSACLAKRDSLGSQRITESAMRISALVALPCGFGLFALGTPIISLITLGNVDPSIAGPLLSILGLASIFVCIQLIAASILQANGIVNLPIATVVIGGVVKIVVNYALVGDPRIMIYGAPVGTLCCFLVVSVLNLMIIKWKVPNPPRYLTVFFKPLIASAVMGGAAWAVHGLLAKFLYGSLLKGALATAGGIFGGAIVYIILVVALRVLSKADVDLMPGGQKIAKFLHIR